ncbi:MAG: Cof-type HAD-IIB family hydrolase [Kiritimatiellae bacterium]|nr:Cof-type HAD-IIB family hydrolase [Kiritimatiellia bacterium]
MADIRIIALDLDGTLLDSAKRLSDVNREALAAAAAKGVWVVPTTGRFFGMMPPAIRDLPFVRYAITVNGAQVYDREADAALVREELPLETALGIMRILDGHDVIYDCYRNNWGWMNEAFKDKRAEYATNEHYCKMIQDFRNGVPELKAHLEATRLDGDVQKIMLFSRLDADVAVLKTITDEVEAAYPDVKVTSSTWNNLEINAKTAHKGVALRRFAEVLGLTLDNCMSFGDGANDLTMIEAAGTGVAMSNACPEVLAAADYVTTSNDEDGVAAALRHFGLA